MKQIPVIFGLVLATLKLWLTQLQTLSTLQVQKQL